MKVVILTSSRYGTASHHIPVLVGTADIEVVAVICSEGVRKRRLRHMARKLAKIMRIGVGGALNGLRMRSWYHVQTEELSKVCDRLGVPFISVPSVNDQETVKAFQRTGADIGISLGNGYISQKVFKLPRLGMINVHHEILPEYQNAQSVIWQLYNGSTRTGYTIHRINEKIDAGAIIHQEEIPITFKPLLSDTVKTTYMALLDASAAGLAMVLADLETFLAGTKMQGRGGRYTTPTLRAFRRIQRNHDRLGKEASHGGNS